MATVGRIVEGEAFGFPVPGRWPRPRRRTKRDGGLPGLGLVVLRTAQMSRARGFYEAVGLGFVEEQHGGGPVHLAATLPSGMVLELYPATGDPELERGSVGDVRLGFDVEDVEAAVRGVSAAGGVVISEPGEVDGEVRAVVADPDGRRVVLNRGS